MSQTGCPFSSVRKRVPFHSFISHDFASLLLAVSSRLWMTEQLMVFVWPWYINQSERVAVCREGGGCLWPGRCGWGEIYTQIKVSDHWKASEAQDWTKGGHWSPDMSFFFAPPDSTNRFGQPSVSEHSSLSLSLSLSLCMYVCVILCARVCAWSLNNCLLRI